ncbi:MAG: hypothetical protein AAF515_15940 [Pseudomonadota bacterium]
MPDPDSMTNLLKAHGAKLSAVKANKLLLQLGLLEEKSRPSSKYPDKVKKYKALTEAGLAFGENRENPQSEETTPVYFRDSFADLLLRMQARLDD